MAVKTVIFYLKKKGTINPTQYQVKFMVSDSVQMKAILGATVECQGKILTVDVNGLTPIIELPTGSYSATASYLDFEPLTKAFTLP